MIEVVAKAAEITEAAIKETAGKSEMFDPDKRIEPGRVSSEIKGAKKYDPDMRINEIYQREDGFYTKYDDRVKQTNLDGSEGGLRGNWDGERGDSKFMPSYKYMREALSEYGLNGIDYIKGEADFSPIAKESVRIDNMTSERLGIGRNFDQAYNKLAEQFNSIAKDGNCNWDARAVEEYADRNELTWHEKCDCRTMELVPTKIHKYFHHSGGCAECKIRDHIGGRYDV